MHDPVAAVAAYLAQAERLALEVVEPDWAGVAADERRHAAAFAARARAGGHAAGDADPGLRAQLELARGFASPEEGAAFLHVLHEGFALTLLRRLLPLLPAADRPLFAEVLRDEARHVALGVEKLRAVLRERPERRAALREALRRSERILTREAPEAFAAALRALGGEAWLEETLAEQFADYARRREVLGL